MNDIYYMGDDKLKSIISKFQMPKGEYTASYGDDFGESELYWVVEEKNTHKKYLLVNTYWHPKIEKEMAFYRENGFDVKKEIWRDPSTLTDGEKQTSGWNYLYITYAIFEL